MLESILTLTLMSALLIGAPGPAAMALVDTGAVHNMRQNLPFVLGLIVGVVLTGLLSSVGIMALLDQWPAARVGMRLVCISFILWMAILMIKQPLQCSGNTPVRFGFVTGIMMNLLNPKAYATFAVLTSSFMPPISSKLVSIVVLEGIALMTTFLVACGWLLLGKVLGRFIRNPHGVYKMRVTFACLMVIFVTPMIYFVPAS